MPNFVRVKLENGSEATVSEGFAKSHGLKPLSKVAEDRLGRPIRTKHPVNLKGAALDQALRAAGLATTGSADARRQRLADHQTSAAQSADGTTTTNPAGSNASASQTEE